MSDLAVTHPECALAYVLQDWRRNRDVSKAYKALCDEAPEAWQLVDEALRTLRVYVSALEEIVAARGAPEAAGEDAPQQEPT